MVAGACVHLRRAAETLAGVRGAAALRGRGAAPAAQTRRKDSHEHHTSAQETRWGYTLQLIDWPNNNFNLSTFFTLKKLAIFKIFLVLLQVFYNTFSNIPSDLGIFFFEKLFMIPT